MFVEEAKEDGATCCVIEFPSNDHSALAFRCSRHGESEPGIGSLIMVVILIIYYKLSRTHISCGLEHGLRYFHCRPLRPSASVALSNPGYSGSGLMTWAQRPEVTPSKSKSKVCHWSVGIQIFYRIGFEWRHSAVSPQESAFHRPWPWGLTSNFEYSFSCSCWMWQHPWKLDLSFTAS
jgi:hypothetical protein